MSNKEYHQQYRDKNRERIKSNHKIWRDQNVEKLREEGRKYREENNHKILERQRLRYEEKREECNEYRRNYNISSLRRFLAKKLSNLKKERQNKKCDPNPEYFLDITIDYLLMLWEKQKGICAISGKKMECIMGTPFTMYVDRIDSKIGYYQGNIQLLCLAVNFAKNKYSQEEFLNFWQNPCVLENDDFNI